MVAALASSMIAAVVVGLLVINSNSFKSFRASLSGTDTETKKKSASNEPVEFDPNYDYSKDKRGLGNGEAGKKNQPNTNEDKNKSKPAKPTWNELAADRDIPPALMEPQTDLDIVCQPVKLAISQRNYDQATELFEAASKDAERSPTLAFSDLESRLKTLDKFWRSVRRGLAQCIPGTEIKRCGEWLECVSKGPDFITFRQSSGAEKAFKTDFLYMDTDLAVALQRSVEPKDQDSGNLFAELDFVGNRNLMAVSTELQKAGPKKQIAKKSRDKPKATEPKPAVTSTERENSAQRLPVPDKQQQAAKSKLVRELFDEQYADRTDQGRAALTKLLIKQGNETNDDDAGRFVLYQEALELAEKTGDAQSAWTAVNAIVENYEMDTFEAKVDVLREVSKKFDDETTFAGFVADCRALIQTDVDLDRYDVAMKNSRSLLAVARKGADKTTVNDITDFVARIKTLNKGFAEIEDQLAILDDQPNNKLANQAAGEFYGFIKGDVDKALRFLSLGNDATTSKLGRLTLNRDLEGAKAISLADQWADYGREHATAEEFSYKIAGNIYRSNLESTSGLERKRIEAAISEIENDLAANSAQSAGISIADIQWQVNWEDGKVWRSLRIGENQCEVVTDVRTYLFDSQFENNTLAISNPKSKTIYYLSLEDGQLRAFKESSGSKRKVAGLGVPLTR